MHIERFYQRLEALRIAPAALYTDFDRFLEPDWELQIEVLAAPREPTAGLRRRRALALTWAARLAFEPPCPTRP